MIEPKIINIFIASPKGVENERIILREKIEEINRIVREYNLRLELYGFEDTTPGFGRPQELIDKDVDNCELFIGILWMRWGTSTGKFSSGFEEEFYRAKERYLNTGAPQIWLFFKKVDQQLQDDPGEQLNKIIKFRQEIECKRELLYREFTDEKDWGDIVYVFLHKHILKNLLHSPDASEDPEKFIDGRLLGEEIENNPKSISKGESSKNLSNSVFNDPVFIIGHEKEVENFSQWISDFYQASAINDNVLLICIWGFAGVGKTTLLTKFGEICADKWFMTGMSDNSSALIQIPHPSEPLSAFLSRIHRFEHGANKYETISKFVLSLPSYSALLVDEFRPEDKDFVNSFEWMISQMNTQANHRYLIITTCRRRPRFKTAQVDHYVGTKQGLLPLTLEKTRIYLDHYWKGDLRNNHINEIFEVTHGNPKVINYLYTSPEISEKILSYIDPSALEEVDVIRATWEYVYNDENFRHVADLAAVVGLVSIACPNEIFDLMIKNWYELKKTMLDQSLLEQVGPDTYKMHDLLRDFHYKNMRNADKRKQHLEVGEYYETRNQPIDALEHYVLAEDEKSIERVYRAAYKLMDRNSDYESIIRLIKKYIGIFGARDEFGVDVFTDLGMAYRILTEYRSALSEFDHALSLCNQLVVPQNSLKRAQILWGLGETYRRLDRYKESLEYYDKGILIYRIYENDNDGKDGIARSERGKSAVYKMISRYQESLQGYEVANDIYMNMGNLDGQLYCERGIAAVHMLQGHYIQAQKEYKHSLQLYKERNNPRGIAYACWGYAESLRLKREIETAIEKYIEALDLSRKIGDDWSTIYLSLNLGECYRAKGEFEDARKWHNLIMKLEITQNSPVLQAHYLLATAELQRLEGKADFEIYRKAEKMYQEVPMGMRWGIAHCRIGLCLAELRTLKVKNDCYWMDRMDSITAYCFQNQLHDELRTAKKILEWQDPDELHPLSFP